ncbi:NADPH2:quinone reductase [Rhizobium mongolense subsp. loessense]|uniref:NADPH2:quinone reductase n=1 Tax=Rhizobium mongolense subsp. loessense TaxID=158890 RepID=A0A1G4R9Y2_9HYPH|nr:zinc-binding dehydrogenase [Rhizobium mongolense]SCW53693.1 NADPH2:quinone reductase [Rhizobium mongolense subsp. loessense]
MKAVRYDHFGPPEVLKVVELPKPAPREGDVLVRVRTAGVNYFEVLMRANRYAVTPELPMIPGVEIAGVVEAVGEGADPDVIGARVAVPLFALGRGEGYAEYVAVPRASVILIPDALSFETAVALMVQGLTALHMVRQAPPRDKTVLVHAAAGGVGSLLVQLAKREGAGSVIATASSEKKRSLARTLGADAAIDYTSEGWQEILRENAPVDLIYDTIGGEVTRASLAALAPGGELVFAALGRFRLEVADLNSMFEKNQTLKGFALLPLLTGTLADDLSALFSLAVSGGLFIAEGASFPLDKAADAHRAIESRGVSGKVVVVP